MSGGDQDDGNGPSGDPDELAMRETMPQMPAVPKPSTKPGLGPDTAKTIRMAVQIPPEALPEMPHDESDHVVSSAARVAGLASGSFELTNERVSESVARALLFDKFTAAGFAIETNHTFSREGTLVILDGFDVGRGVGYQFVSHADRDVVTDHDLSADVTFKKLASAGDAHVLVIHDAQATSHGDLEHRIDEFLAGVRQSASQE